MAQRAFQGEVIRLAVWIGTADVGETGLTVTCRVKRTVGATPYWTGAAWQLATTTFAMTEYDSTNFPGLYINTSLSADTADGLYYVQYICAATHIIDQSEIWEVQSSQTADEIWESMIEYIDTDGTEQNAEAWKLLSGMFSVLKRKMKSYSP